MNGAKRFTVKVTAEVEERKVRGKTWEVIGTKTEEEVAKDRGEGVCSKVGTPLYGYTPEIEKLVSEEIKVFEQTVDTLDIAALVAVVNKPTFSGLIGPLGPVTPIREE